MAPTIQNGTNGANPAPVNPETRPQRPVEKKSELICRVKYCNTLPDIPFDLKYITYPFASDRFVQYNPTSLERNYRYEVLTEHDLGVTIDLINRDLYQSDPNSQLDPADEKLLEEDVHTPQDSQRSRHHAKSVSWLRKSEYISTEQTRFQPQNNEKVEAKVGFNVRKSFVEETLYMDRDAQIKSIEKTFVENKTPITKHYSKPNVTPVEVLPFYPDFVNWKYPCAQVIFDSDPAPANTTKNMPAQIEEMSQAMIRGVMDESGEQFVAYFLPTEDTLEKRRADITNGILYEDDQEYEYKMAREYNWNVKSKASKGYEENYFLVFREDGVSYNELETRVRLNKRRQNMTLQPSSTKLVVKHIPLNESEHRMQRYRERQLEPPRDDEEELEEIEEEDVEIDIDRNEDSQEDNKDGGDKAERAKGEDANESGHSSRSSSRSRSRSRSRSKSKSKSRSRSGTPATNRSRSHSGSRSRSGSRSDASNRSRSGSRDTGRSRSRSRSGSGSRSGSATSNRSRSGSRKSGSRSPSRSPSRSGSGSRSGSAASNRSGSGSRKSGSRSASRSRSRSQTQDRSRSGSRTSRSRSRSATPDNSGSGSGSASE